MSLLVLGLVNWVATLIVVDSEIFRPVRERLDRWDFEADERLVGGNRRLRRYRWAAKAAFEAHYFIRCYLCTGTWLALASAAFVAPLVASGFAGWVLTGLAIKGVGHAIIEVVAVLKKWSAV